MHPATEYTREARQVESMFASISQRYDLANSVLSMGIHHLWRRALTSAINTRKSGASPDGCVLDLCTGTGDLLPLLRRRFKKVVGVDFCLPMLEKAGPKIGAGNIQLIQGDGLKLPFRDGQFDAVTVAFGVRNFEDLKTGLSEIRRVLSRDGAAYILEFGQPRSAVMRTAFGFYSRALMPLIGSLLTGNRAAYTYLPKTAATFPCGSNFAGIMAECGFKSVDFKALSGGIAYLYSGCNT